MRVLDILLFMGELGARYPRKKVGLVQNYFCRMIADGRVVSIYKNGELHGLMAFSICDDYAPFWKKDTWDYKSHNPNGQTIYVEFLAAKTWDKKVRQKFQDVILNRFPQIQHAVWHKWADWGDRKVCWRRRCHV